MKVDTSRKILRPTAAPSMTRFSSLKLMESLRSVRPQLSRRLGQGATHFFHMF